MTLRAHSFDLRHTGRGLFPWTLDFITAGRPVSLNFETADSAIAFASRNIAA